MDHLLDALKEFQPRHEFLIGVDSDGCIFDTMEIKQKECFVPVTIASWDLQAVAEYARETIEFVNLYSRWRGSNRFIALDIEMEFLADRPEVRERGVAIPNLAPLREWTAAGGALSNAALREAVERTGNAVLQRVLRWSEAVNQRIAEVVRGVPPFPAAASCLARMVDAADLIVVSQTPGEALSREWEEHGLRHLPARIAGQEMGAKSDQLRAAAGGKYRPGCVLMIGDALGDLRAARDAGALFFPINPGREEESWARLAREGLDRFFAGRFAGTYEEGLLREFERLLPSIPPWRK